MPRAGEAGPQTAKLRAALEYYTHKENVAVCIMSSKGYPTWVIRLEFADVAKAALKEFSALEEEANGDGG